MKVIKSLENREILLKGTTRKIPSQEGGLLNFFRLLMAAGLLLMKNVLTRLSKSVLLPLGLTAAVSVADASIQKKTYESGTIALIISNEEMEDIIKIIKSRKESRLLIKGISETIKNKSKEQKSGSLPMLLGILASRVLGSALTRRGAIREGEGTIRNGQNF